VKWLVKRNPDVYANPVEGDMPGQAQLYGAAMRQGDPDWLQWVNTCFDVAMYGHEDAIYDAALRGILRREADAAANRVPTHVRRQGEACTTTSTSLSSGGTDARVFIGQVDLVIRARPLAGGWRRLRPPV
jgi:hypothetical protein